MTSTRSSSGLGAIEALMLLAIVGILGFAGWHVYQTRRIANQSYAAQTNASKTAGQSTDPYAGWRAFTSVEAGYHIRYPGTWTLRKGTNNGGAESVVLTSPDSFSVTLLSFTKATRYGADAFAANPTGQCGVVCLKSEKQALVSVPKVGSLEIDAQAQGAGAGVSNALALNTAAGSAYIASPVSSGVYTTISGVYVGTANQAKASGALTAFTDSASVKTAEQIYRSLRY